MYGLSEKQDFLSCSSSSLADSYPIKKILSCSHHIVGPLPPSAGFTHLLIMIDRTTCRPGYCLLSDTSAHSCVLGLISTWVARFGSLSILTSDKGSQFTSEV